MAFDFPTFRAHAAVYMEQAGQVFMPKPDAAIADEALRTRLYEAALLRARAARQRAMHEMGMRTAVIFASEAFADELSPEDFPSGLTVEQVLERAKTRASAGDAENLARAGILLLAAGVLKMME